MSSSPAPDGPGPLPDSPRDRNEIEAGDGGGRRWYHLRPQPRRRSDLMGFNSTWWMVVAWLIVIVLIASPYPWWW